MILPALQLSALLPHTPTFPPSFTARLQGTVLEQSGNDAGRGPGTFFKRGRGKKIKKKVARSHSLTASILPSCIRVRLATLRYLDFEERGIPAATTDGPADAWCPG